MAETRRYLMLPCFHIRCYLFYFDEDDAASLGVQGCFYTNSVCVWCVYYSAFTRQLCLWHGVQMALGCMLLLSPCRLMTYEGLICSEGRRRKVAHQIGLSGRKDGKSVVYCAIKDVVVAMPSELG